MRVLSFSIVLTVLLTPFPAPAQVLITNGADIDMTGSTGSQIIFPNGTTLGAAPNLVIPPGHGGTANTVSGTGAFIGGGSNNTANGNLSTIGGGTLNEAGGYAATVSGGRDNAASAISTTIGGGTSNTASGIYSTIGGGFNNSAAGSDSTIAGGSGNTANGSNATVAGGGDNAASGDFSFAAGHRAKIAGLHDGAILLADGKDVDFDSVAAYEFAVRATGGARIVTAISLGDPIAGVSIDAGGTAWEVISARGSKENFAEIDPVEILDTLAAMDIQRWNYKANDDSVQHIGPVAEDFHEAFKLDGEYDGRINTQDLDGVALAAIQGLNKKLQWELAEKQRRIDDLETRLALIEAKLTAATH